MKVDQSTFKEIIETRLILEFGAIDLVINHFDINKINQLAYWNEQMKSKCDNNIKAKQEDMEFHAALFDATGNTIYYQFSRIISHYFISNNFEELTTISDFKKAYHEHKRIIMHIMNKDNDAAKQELKKHLQPVYSFI